MLGTVVRVRGSTYRRAGARVLVLGDERTVGLISGGCLEGDLALRARNVRETGAAELVVYDATEDDDIVWGLGLGCAGVVEVLLEPVSPGAPGPLEALRTCFALRRAGVLGTVVGGGPDASPLASHPDVDPADAARVTELGRPEIVTRGEGRGRCELLVEPLLPPTPLVVFGGGPDAAPVVRLAAGLGWDVRVWDARPAFADPARFPEAREVVCCPPDEARARVAVDARAVALVMTHHYLNDRALLAWLLPSPARYLGVLGPRQRTEDLLRDLRGEGAAVAEDRLERLHAPAGLDLGAEGAEAIALALVAEIEAFLAGRGGGPLRDRKGPIHDPTP